MVLDLKKYGITESTLDLRSRLLISCLKSEYDNYQWIVIESQAFEYYKDTDEGVAAYDEDEGIPVEGAFQKVTSWILYGDGFEGGPYEQLNSFPRQLHELRPFLSGAGNGFTSDGEDGLMGFESTYYYPTSSEAFEITAENSAGLLEALEELDLTDDFWAAAAEAMRSTLQRSLCNHSWISDIDGLYCADCLQRSWEQDEPPIGRGVWLQKTKSVAAQETHEEPFSDDLAADRQKLLELADSGSAQAMKLIGLAHAKLEENALAAEWYQKAIELGNLDALSNLGVLRFIEDEYPASIELLVAAANRGSKMAMGNLGTVYAGLRKEALSLLWLSRAAQFGDGESALEAAELFLKKNKTIEAKAMLKIAADLGFEEARNRLGELDFDLDRMVQGLEAFASSNHMDADDSKTFIEFGRLLFTDATAAISDSASKEAIIKAFSESQCENCFKDISPKNVAEIGSINYQYCEACGWLSWQSEQNLEGQLYIVELKPTKSLGAAELVKFGLHVKEVLSSNRESWGDLVLSSSDSLTFRSAPTRLSLILIPRNWYHDVDYDADETAAFNELPIEEKVERLLQAMYEDFGSLGYRDAKNELRNKFEDAKSFGFELLDVIEVGTTEDY